MTEPRLATYDDFEVGQRASFAKTITEADLSHFLAVTGDANPLHFDEGFAARTFLGERIAHGMLTASLLSHVIGMVLPGTGALYRSQTLEFLRPVRLGDTLRAWLEVVTIDEDDEMIELASWIENQDGDRVLEGESVVTLIRSLTVRYDERTEESDG